MNKSKRSPITTHILDLGNGKPAKGISVCLELSGAQGKWKKLANGKTNGDGRVEDLLPVGSLLKKGTYRLKFETRKYFKDKSFFPYVEIVFKVEDLKRHYHVPLLLNQFGYSTYRGS